MIIFELCFGKASWWIVLNGVGCRGEGGVSGHRSPWKYRSHLWSTYIKSHKSCHLMLCPLWILPHLDHKWKHCSENFREHCIPGSGNLDVTSTSFLVYCLLYFGVDAQAACFQLRELFLCLSFYFFISVFSDCPWVLCTDTLSFGNLQLDL